MKVTKLTEDWLLIEATTTQRTKVPVHIQIREPSSGARLGKVIEEYDTTRDTTEEVTTGDVAVITLRQYNLMQGNYALEGCCITWKGVMRYSAAHYSARWDTWYGQPGQTARLLVSQGIPCPKKVHSLFTRIGDSV